MKHTGDTFRTLARRQVEGQAALRGEQLSPAQVEERATDTIEAFLGPWRSVQPEPDRTGQTFVLRRWEDGPLLDGAGREVSAMQLEALERQGAQVVIIRRVIVHSKEADNGNE